MNIDKIVYGRSKTDEELQQILALQQKYLFAKVGDRERKREGFLTVAHTFELVRKMNNACPHIIAKAKGTVVGYALCMHPKFANEIALLKPMFHEIEALNPKIENFIVMGQICVTKSYRKKGVFRNLYRTMQDALNPDFKAIITEVDAKNTRSLEAHYAIGFEQLKAHTSGGQDWELIILK